MASTGWSRRERRFRRALYSHRERRRLWRDGCDGPRGRSRLQQPQCTRVRLLLGARDVRQRAHTGDHTKPEPGGSGGANRAGAATAATAAAARSCAASVVGGPDRRAAGPGGTKGGCPAADWSDPLWGVAGLLLIPAAGATLGYRQARAAQAVDRLRQA